MEQTKLHRINFGWIFWCVFLAVFSGGFAN